MRRVIFCARCSQCGAIQVAAEKVTVRICDEGVVVDHTVRVQCPHCDMRSVAPIDVAMAAILLKSGARLERWSLPLELAEHRAQDAPITHDDLIDFHEQLAKLPTAAQLDRHLFPIGPDWLATPEAARYLGLGAPTLHRLINEGLLPAYNVERVIRIKVSDLDAYIDACRIEPGTLTHLYSVGDVDDAG